MSRKNVLLATVLLCATAGLSMPAAAQGEPDCKAPQTQADMTICAGKDYEKADKQLNVEYQKLRKLLTDPGSPWVTLAWDLPLTAQAGGQRHLVKKVVCQGCGAPKAIPPKTAYVYCDHCGELCDYDFRIACSRPAALPGPAYENLRAQIAVGLDNAKKKGDRKSYKEVQKRLYEAYVVECPMACPPRVGDAGYRARYVEYFASTATDNDFERIEAVIAEHYTPERIRAEVRAPQGWDGWLVAIDEGTVVGAGGGGMTEPHAGEIFVLYLDPLRRREGIGTLLLDRITQL